MKVFRVRSGPEGDARQTQLIIGGIAVALVVLALVGFFFLPRSRLDVPASPTTAAAPSGAFVWRVDGRIIDTAFAPVEGVCVAVGPNGCQPVNPRSDADGKWFIDFPQVSVAYELHFIKQGYKQVDVQIDLKGPNHMNIVMEKLR